MEVSHSYDWNSKKRIFGPTSTFYWLRDLTSLHNFPLLALIQLHRPSIDRLDCFTVNDHFTDFFWLRCLTEIHFTGMCLVMYIWYVSNPSYELKPYRKQTELCQTVNINVKINWKLMKSEIFCSPPNLYCAFRTSELVVLQCNDIQKYRVAPEQNALNNLMIALTW